MTSGLSVSGAPTYVSRSEDGTVRPKPDSVSYSNGVFNIGTLKGGDTVTAAEPVKNSVTLPVTVSSSAVVNEQCLAARLTGNPPPGTGPYDDDISDNVAKVCLTGSGPPGRAVFASGETSLPTWYNCVGRTAYPCSSTDSVEFVVLGESAAVDAGLPYQVFKPDKVVIHVPDPSGRGTDSATGSSALVWSTGNDKSPVVRQGVVLTEDLVSLDFSQWGVDVHNDDSRTATLSVEVSGPGKMSTWAADGDIYEFFGSATNGALQSGTWYLGAASWYAEFSELGTYRVKFGGRIAKNNGTPTDTSDDTNYDIVKRTIVFHVGSIADLTVKDGGSSAHVAADRSALTIAAVNNGPSHSPGARVTGLPTGAEVIHISQGSYNGSNGVWNIGELKHKEFLRSAGKPEPTLVLGASAGDTASISIAGTKNYEVCIGSDRSDLAHTTQATCEAVTGASWHTGSVYDYKPDNNSATIRAARGTGGRTVQPTPSRPVGGPVAPANLTAQTGTTTVKWDAVGLLYGLPVVRYEVQELQGSDWRLLDRVTTHNEYAVMQPRGRSYRVRAVNAAGAVGPWSQSTAEVAAGLPGSPLNLRARADGNNAIDVSWDAPDDIGGSAITGYTVEWSPNAPGSWRVGARPSASARTWKHGGLSVGAVNYYRVAARNSGGMGLWTDPVMGQTVSGAPDKPTLQAKTLSDYQIELTWNQPKDNGEAITGYEIEWSSDGSAGSWERLAAPGADAKSYTDATLQANTKRYYRIRAVNSVGNGAWSSSVSTTTQLTPPWAPTISSVEADGPNAIVVTWEEPFLWADELPITQYQVQYAKSQYAETWRGPQTLSGSARSWRHTGLQPDETWYYQVRASNGGGRWSVWSYISAATTASQDAPTASPGGLRATYDAASRSVTLTWNRPSGQATITGYDLQYSDDNSRWRDLTTTGPDALTYTDDSYNVYPGGDLYYRVRAATDDGDGPWSRSVRVSVPADPPDKPGTCGWEPTGRTTSTWNGTRRTTTAARPSQGTGCCGAARWTARTKTRA